MQMGRIRWLVLPAVVGIAGYFALFGGDYSVFDVSRARQQLVDRGTELDQLKAETDSLAARAEALEDDPHALEEIARGRYGMLAKGEVLYNITGSDSARVADSIAAEGNPTPQDEA